MKTKWLNLALVSLLCLISCVISVAAEEIVCVQYNGTIVDFDVPAQVINGRTMVPIRKIFELMGATVEWNEDTQTATSKKGDHMVSMTINSNTMYIDGNAVVMDCVPITVNDRTLVPVRYVAEAFGCDVDWVEETSTVLLSDAQKIDSIVLNTPRNRIAIGENVTLDATVSPVDIIDYTVSWSVDDASLANIDANGKLTVLSSGIITVTAAVDQVSSSIEIEGFAPLTGITLEKNDIVRCLGERFVVKPIIEPTDASINSMVWSSSDTTVATVNENGTIHCIGVGNAVVTVTADGFSASTEITSKKKFQSMSLDSTDMDISVGTSKALTTKFDLIDLSTPTLFPVWESSDPSVATVDENGIVTALSKGNAIITAKLGMNQDRCFVHSSIKAQKIELSQSSIKEKVGGSANLQANVIPSDAEDTNIIWSSSDPSVVTVNNKGELTIIDKGTATITATNGTLEAKCDVESYIAVRSIILNKTAITTKIGGTDAIKAQISPATAENKLEWSSSNPQSVKVSSYGVITALAEGDAIITAKAGDVAASCKVHVQGKGNRISGTHPNIALDDDDNNDSTSAGSSTLVSLSYSSKFTLTVGGSQYMNLQRDGNGNYSYVYTTDYDREIIMSSVSFKNISKSSSGKITGTIIMKGVVNYDDYLWFDIKCYNSSGAYLGSYTVMQHVTPGSSFNLSQQVSFPAGTQRLEFVNP